MYADVGNDPINRTVLQGAASALGRAAGPRMTDVPTQMRGFLRSILAREGEREKSLKHPPPHRFSPIARSTWLEREFD